MNWFIWECMSTNKERLYIQNQQIMGHEKKVHIYIYLQIPAKSTCAKIWPLS
jgi:hypothetical protein